MYIKPRHLASASVSEPNPNDEDDEDVGGWPGSAISFGQVAWASAGFGAANDGVPLPPSWALSCESDAVDWFESSFRGVLALTKKNTIL